MKHKFRILVFPCGSEIGLEIYRSLRYSKHVDIIGGSSVDDHGRFVYDTYIGGLPYIHEENLISAINSVVVKEGIDAIYPAMDEVAHVLKQQESGLGCRVIGSSFEVNAICVSKSKTYNYLQKIVRTPKRYQNIDDIPKDEFPIFIKPDVGYGSRGVLKADNYEVAIRFTKENHKKELLLLEWLPGDEYTVDCFTDRHNKLRFVGPRERNRIKGGISVNTTPVRQRESEFIDIAEKINRKIGPRGAWFFQVKENNAGELTLLEVASRLGGSSSLYRNKGVNFALLSVFDAFEYDVNVFANDYAIELDRALSNRYRIKFEYEKVFVDFDDCLILDNKVRTKLVAFLYQTINQGKETILITKHDGNINSSLSRFRMENLFDKVVHIDSSDAKSKYIDSKSSIFIDDSFAERREVYENAGIPVFSPDMIESLLS